MIFLDIDIYPYYIIIIIIIIIIICRWDVRRAVRASTALLHPYLCPRLYSSHGRFFTRSEV